MSNLATSHFRDTEEMSLHVSNLIPTRSFPDPMTRPSIFMKLGREDWHIRYMAMMVEYGHYNISTTSLFPDQRIERFEYGILKKQNVHRFSMVILRQYDVYKLLCRDDNLME